MGLKEQTSISRCSAVSCSSALLLSVEAAQNPVTTWKTEAKLGVGGGRVEEGTKLMNIYLQSQVCEINFAGSEIVLPNICTLKS